MGWQGLGHRFRYQHGGDMWTGSGPRQIASDQVFSEAFRAPPSVMVSVSMWDIAAGSNARADVRAEEVTAAGFQIIFSTWGDTRVARIRVGWMAIGELRHPDDWDIE
ncbi:H-type lectin domain protein [Roseisalinus antarcticus]|uniref:H-type lectin domain protein n=2 Tax=Roseisalinus antarcticus TaxID=254357 RepID=A0A1Y5TKT0_9RHOB|nr:H-type lectin domain protein [Roseisalinus antarcticus]